MVYFYRIKQNASRVNGQTQHHGKNRRSDGMQFPLQKVTPSVNKNLFLHM